MDFISLLVALLSLTIHFISFLLTASEDIRIQSLVIFGIMIIVTIIFSIIYFIYQRYRGAIQELHNNKRELDEIRKSLNYKGLFDNMDVRVRVLEKLLDKKIRKAR